MFPTRGKEQKFTNKEKIGLPFPGRQRSRPYSWAGYAASSAPHQPSNTIRATQPAYLKWFDLGLLYAITGRRAQQTNRQGIDNTLQTHQESVGKQAPHNSHQT